MTRKNIGVLGGGQLGRMLLQAASNFDIPIHILEKSKNCPAAALAASITEGDILDPEDVLRFGRKMDILTIEIEHVSSEALETLEQEGKTVFPRARVLKTIQDKGLQKQFYHDHQIPTSPFTLTESKADLKRHPELMPGFHKLRRFGYDGKGVQAIAGIEEWQKGFDEPGMLEKAVDIEMEISVIVVANEKGQSTAFPPVEQVFDPKYNLVDYLLSPARITDKQAEEAGKLARRVVEAFDSPGIFAVEMFLDKTGALLVNEVAPRTHNSGHQSIEGNYASQFDQQLRALLNLPLGSTETRIPSLMINLIGAEGFEGTPHYKGLNDILSIPGVYVHLYGKKQTRPGRKMGHITLVANDVDTLLERAQLVKKTIRVIT